jgi:hypothetical protein
MEAAHRPPQKRQAVEGGMDADSRYLDYNSDRSAESDLIQVARSLL